MLLLRKIIFWLFLVIYLIACPLLILHSLGYILNPIKHGLTQTGLVYLSTLPPGADVFLGKSHFANKTPASIHELQPGTYTIKLFLKGHKPWKHSVTIEAGKAQAFENILLLPLSLRIERASKEAFKTLLPLDGTDFFLVATGTGLGDYFIFDTKNNAIKGLVSSDSPFFSFSVSSIFTQEKSSQLVLYGGPLGKRRYLLMQNPQNTESPVTDITKLFLEKPQYLSWEPDGEAHIFAVYQGYIGLLNLKTFATSPRFIENIKGYGLLDKWLYYIDPDNTIWRISFDREKQEKFSEETPFSEALFKKSGFYKIKFLKKGLALFVSDRGQLLTNLTPYEIQEEGVIDVMLNKDKIQLAYWTKHSIRVVHLFADSNPESLFKEEASTQIVYENGRNIQQCFWVDNTHIIFRDSNKIFLLEIEPQGSHRIEPLIEVKSGSSIFYSGSAGSLYYLDRKNGNLCKIKIP